GCAGPGFGRRGGAGGRVARAGGPLVLRGRSALMEAEEPRCPVCRARWRAAVCARCGADLAPLLVLRAEAYRERALARDLLRAGDARAAAQHAERAQAIAASPDGERLRTVADVLVALENLVREGC